MRRLLAATFLFLLGCALGASAQATANHGYLGVNYKPDETGVVGCTVAQIDPEGAAARAGIKVGDVVTGLDAATVTTCNEFGSRMQATKPGQNLAVHYQRNGQAFTAQVVLGTAPPPPPEPPPTVSITLDDNPRSVRFTVGHSHAMSYCFGYLDITADTVTYRSLTQPEHSFTYARTAVTGVKVSMGSWAHFTTTKNWDFIIVSPKVVSGELTLKTAKPWSYDPHPIVNYLLNFDASWTAEWNDIQSRQPRKPPEPTTPPTPTTARVLVITDPGGAQVYLDDVFKGESSDKGELRVEAPPGAHAVRVRLAGYKEWTGSVAFDGNGENRQHVVLLKNGPEPLAEDEIEQGLAGGITPARMVDKVKELGVNFNLTDDIEKKLRAAGADDALLLEIAKNKK